jgi:hypothetical protein
MESALLQEDDQALISATLDAVVEPVVYAYDEGDVVQEVEWMAKTVTANRAQVRAARLLVSRAARGTGQASPAVRAIAKAEPPRAEQRVGTVAAARGSED